MVSLLPGTLWWCQWGRFLEDSRGRQRHRKAKKLSPSVCHLTLQTSWLYPLPWKPDFLRMSLLLPRALFCPYLAPQEKWSFTHLVLLVSGQDPQLFILRNSRPLLAFLFHHRSHGAGLCSLLVLGTVCWSWVLELLLQPLSRFILTRKFGAHKSVGPSMWVRYPGLVSRASPVWTKLPFQT